ncbi:hypothetical protein Nepgr_010168 [Nepenthes gracilis]|uniref:CW-type domain-containing protein n=1 Tax=Nepenthes gracilis TaxID=150966 RepID=A0AAD3SBQ7_NEPGR|nr:hypothetical protein Nepgr_010168 [Nepenthes gracilis]
MEETGFEGGEACYILRDGDENANIDPDIALSYIDEKVQHVLGHFQKDFEGGVSAENLGAKFGGYGSFLPTYQWSPSVSSQPKSPGGSHNTRSTTTTTTTTNNNNSQFEGATKSSTMPLNAPSLGWHTTTSEIAKSLNSERLVSIDVPAERESRLNSSQALGKLRIKHDASNKLDCFTDERNLKVRIKVGSDDLTRKTATIYSGLGLDISPSSSGNSAEETASFPSESLVTSHESPTSILQIMTTFPSTGILLLSPLGDKFLFPRKEERHQKYNTSELVCKDSPGRSVMSAGGTDDMMLSVKISMEKARKLFLEKGTRMNEGQMVVDGSALKLTPVIKSAYNISNSMENTGTTTGMSREAARHGTKDCLVSSESAKESPFEWPSDKDCSISDKRFARIGSQSSLVDKYHEYRVASSSKNVSTDLQNDSMGIDGKTSLSHCRNDHDAGFIDSLEEKVGREAISANKKDEIKMSCRTGKPSNVVEKKVNGSYVNGKLVANLEKKSNETVKDKKKSNGDHPNNDGIHKSKKYNGTSKDNGWSAVDITPGRLHKQRCGTFVPSDDRQNDLIMKDSDTDPCTLLYQPEEKTSKEVDDPSASLASLAKAPTAGLHITENGLPSEALPAATVVINENWVCCDSCLKWRLLPLGTLPEHLPEDWLCSMLNWLPGMNRCDVSEEETTKAMRALCQLPLAENQNYANGHAGGVPGTINSVSVQCPDVDLNSNSLSTRRKRKHGSRELLASDKGGVSLHSLTYRNPQKIFRDRTVNDMEQPSLESHLMNKPGVLNSRMSHNPEVQKHIDQKTEKHMSEGDAKKKKRKADSQVEHYGKGASQKVKSEGKSYITRYWNSDLDVDLGKVGAPSNMGFSAKAPKRDLQNYNDGCHLKTFKCDSRERLSVSIKKVGERSHLSDVRSPEMKKSHLSSISLKKKLNVRKDSISQNHPQNSGHHFLNFKVSAKEENSDAEINRAKKLRVSETEKEEEEHEATKSGKSQKKSKVNQNLLSSGDHTTCFTVEVRSVEEDQKLKKHRGDVAGEKSLDGLNLLKKDFGPGQVSVAATSSSSKVSGSHKRKENFEELKGSPVESVSSSPFRTINAHKLAPVECKKLRNFNDTNGEDNDRGIPPRVARKEKFSGVSHSKSLKYPGQNFPDEIDSCKSIEKDKSSIELSFKLGNSEMINDHNCISERRQNPDDPHLNYCNVKDGLNTNYAADNVLCQQKPGHKSHLQRKAKEKSYGDFSYNNEVKLSQPLDEHEEQYARKREAGTCPLQQTNVEIDPGDHSFPIRDSIKLGMTEKNYVSNKDPTGMLVAHRRLEGLAMFGGHMNGKDIQPRDLNQKTGGEQFCNQIHEQGMHMMRKESVNGKSQSLPNHNGKQDRVAWDYELPPGFRKGVCNLSIPKQAVNAASQSSAHNRLGSTRQPLAADINDVAHVRKECLSQKSNDALKEAEDLRDYADHLKNSGFDFESNEIYFQAALKFLDVASLFETCDGDGKRNGEMTQIQIYIIAAKLCDSCAREYERCQEMAAAALAYKCMEVAYMWIVYCKHFFTGRLRNELQATLPMAPQGESPLSSASDVDNLNTQVSLEKAVLSKGIGPYVAGGQLTPQHRNFVLLLDFTQDVNMAMEASLKWQNAFAAAKGCLPEMHNKEFMTSVKRVIDFSFQDVGELIEVAELIILAFQRQSTSFPPHKWRFSIVFGHKNSLYTTIK